MIAADTNLLVYLLLTGEHTAAAERVLEQDAEWAVPLLWRSELRNVLALYLRRGLLAYEAALEVFQQAELLVQGREYEVDTAQVMACVSESSCSAYDCEFVSLAHELKVPLVTSDRKVIATFPSLAVSPEDFGRK
ncbi:type II toxin-antitoxin system VapC family toxin [Aquisalimonas sp.]|uniref:type II toxin-antitoxin system VapC family toxin n=1 Tax=Aquisalimonas sp. TaxID=1872621 RepID=UPI0025C1134D|nr:type II toxin-antitoxin system VapC family toxin [Aquisalimonas sp.]